MLDNFEDVFNIADFESETVRFYNIPTLGCA